MNYPLLYTLDDDGQSETVILTKDTCFFKRYYRSSSKEYPDFSVSKESVLSDEKCILLVEGMLVSW